MLKAVCGLHLFMAIDEEQLLDTIYAAALDPGLWPRAMSELSDVVGGNAAVLSRLDIVSGAGAAVVLNNNRRTLADYFGYYYRINPLQLVDDPASYVAGWTPKMLRDEDWIDRETFEASEYYNDFLRPIEAEWGVILRLGLNGHELTALSIGRAYRHGRFEDAEVAALARFHPHLIRATGLGRRYATIQQCADGLAAAVDRSRTAMMLVDADAVLLHANAAADRLIRADDALSLREGRLTARDPAGGHALSAAIAGAASADRSRRIAGSFELPLPGCPAPLRGAAMPVLENEAALFARGCAALVSVTHPVADAGSLAAAFGLTAAEGRLAADLLAGLDLRASAARRDISINTVRSQLASAFAKTGTHRQVDLVRLLAATEAGRLDG